jgi:hypothetical protein
MRADEPTNFDFSSIPSRWKNWKWTLMAWGGLGLIVLLVLLATWSVFFKYVPPGHHLVIVAKNGDPLDPGEVLASPGQKGIQREVLGEGWHYITPIVYATEVEENTTVPPGKVGIVTALGGKPRAGDKELADGDEQGIQRQVLPPGTYRINKHGYQVELVPATEITSGFVGVMRRLLGTKGEGLFAKEGTDQKGYLPKVLQPGIYYINTKEFEVIKVEVGIFQTTFSAPKSESQTNTAITFPSKGGFPISLDCTVEWEVLPAHMPSLVAEYGSRREVEKKVIDVQAHAIGRDKGIDYGVQDFLEGSTREKFQEDFTQELTRVCAEKNVTIHSAFIRRIDIPEEYLKPIRDRQIAIETQLTTKAKEVTAETDNEVEREQRMIQQGMAQVEAKTKMLVAALDQEVQNVNVRTDAEIEKMKAEYASKIAALDAERIKLLGQAEAEVTRLKETAKSNLYQLKMDVFQNDASAFLRYTLAQELNPNMVLRLFHSGSGTLWTNMDGKGINLLLPTPGGPISPAQTSGQQTQNGSANKDAKQPSGQPIK